MCMSVQHPCAPLPTPCPSLAPWQALCHVSVANSRGMTGACRFLVTWVTGQAALIVHGRHHGAHSKTFVWPACNCCARSMTGLSSSGKAEACPGWRPAATALFELQQRQVPHLGTTNICLQVQGPAVWLCLPGVPELVCRVTCGIPSSRAEEGSGMPSQHPPAGAAGEAVVSLLPTHIVAGCSTWQ